MAEHFLSNRHAQIEKRSEQALALNPQSDIATWKDPDWQRLWLAVEAKPWRALALVPAGDGASTDFTVSIAVALSRTAMVHLGSPIQVADATRVPLNQLNPFLDEVRRVTSTGERLLLALPPTSSGPICTSIAQTADAAILCVLLEAMTSSQANDTIRHVGQARFLGSAIFHAHQAGPTVKT
jgi:hypothetical protein